MNETLDLDLDSFPVHDTTWWLGWFPSPDGGCYFWIDADGGTLRHFETVPTMDEASLYQSFLSAIDRDDETAEYGRPTELLCTDIGLTRRLRALESDSFSVSFRPQIPFLSEMFGRITEMASGRASTPPVFLGMDDPDLATELIEQALELFGHKPWSHCQPEQIFSLAEGAYYGSFRVDGYGPCLILVKGREGAESVFSEGRFHSQGLALSFLPAAQARIGLQSKVQELGRETTHLFEVNPLLPEVPDFEGLTQVLKTLNATLSGGHGLAGAESVEWPLSFQVSAAGLARQASWQLDLEVRQKAAKRALEMDPNCAQAYQLLAADAVGQELVEHRKAVLRARRRGWANGLPSEQQGDWLMDFWALGDCLKDSEPQQLQQVCRDYLDCAPDSPCGAASTLVMSLLQSEQFELGDEHLQQPTTFWGLAGRAILEFLRAGDVPVARQARAAAVLRNPQLVLYSVWPHYNAGQDGVYQEAADFVLLARRHLGHLPELFEWVGQGRSEVVSDPAWLRELGAPEPTVSQPVRREGPKLGRNDPCWCGSGKKYKKCHLAKD